MDQLSPFSSGSTTLVRGWSPCFTLQQGNNASSVDHLVHAKSLLVHAKVKSLRSTYIREPCIRAHECFLWGIDRYDQAGRPALIHQSVTAAAAASHVTLASRPTATYEWIEYQSHACMHRSDLIWRWWSLSGSLLFRALASLPPRPPLISASQGC